MQQNTTAIIKTSVILLTFTALCLVIFHGCTKDDPKLTEKSIYNATIDLNYAKVDSFYQPILQGYIDAYELTTNPDSWDYQNVYNLDQFNLLVIAHDESVKNNIEGLYVVTSINNLSKFKDYEIVHNSNTSDAIAIRLFETELVDQARNILTSEGSKFGSFTRAGMSYLFIVDKSPFQYYTAANKIFEVNQKIGFYIHEGFHIFSQRSFSRPQANQTHIRHNIPIDYPADSVSFSLHASGIKLYENVLFDPNTDYLEHLELLHTIFYKLVELDSSNQEYIKNHYFYYTWSEGGAEFIENKIQLATGYLYDQETIRWINSLDFFIQYIKSLVDQNVTTTNVNGISKNSRYSFVVDRTYYKLGACALFILDNLGVNVAEELQNGKTPPQLLAEYIEQHDIDVDFENRYSELKLMIDWDSTTTLMQSYINLWK